MSGSETPWMGYADTEPQKFSQWAIVDVMGHQRYIGFVTEQVIAGTGFVRVDVPEVEGIKSWSKLIGTGSIYAITPVSEEIARGVAARERAKAVQPYELPPRPALAAVAHDSDDLPPADTDWGDDDADEIE